MNAPAQQPSSLPASKNIPVIYIAGAGRSGSTVLDTILGNHPDVFSVGELSYLPLAAWISGEYCACGERGDCCGFWKQVFEQWNLRTGGADVPGYVALQRKFERFRRWPRWGREMLWPSACFKNYQEQTYHLFASILAVSGRRVVVDSSKSILRGALLSSIPGIDVRFVHLVRDVRGVAWSQSKPYARDEKGGIQRDMPGIPAWKTAAKWTLANILAGTIRRRRGSNAVLVRYEDLVSKPVDALARMETAVGLDLSELSADVAAGEPMKVGHTIAGNRLRMSGAIKLRADWEWMRCLPDRDRRRCWAIAGWLLRRYGYRRCSKSDALPEASASQRSAA